MSRGRIGPRPLALLLALARHGPALVLVFATLVLVGQPIYANDTWIHLALGERFLADGPFLDADPFLFAAPGPPAPSSWLGSAAIAGGRAVLGWAGLRALHVAFVLGILALAWQIARRTSRSPAAASLVVVAFVALGTYRFVQLRPELFTIAATLALHPLLLAPRQGPDARRIAVAAGGVALWANVHAAFLLGPLLVLGVAASLAALAVVARPFRPHAAGAHLEEGIRVRRLAIAGLVMLAASLLNPLGVDAHLAYFAAGDATLDLSAVTDEWARTDLFAWPPANRPPTWPAWLLSWLSVGAIVWGASRVARETFGGRDAQARAADAGLVEAAPAQSSGAGGLDPACLALAVAGTAAALLATRFLWLELFALALGARLVRDAIRGTGIDRGATPLVPALALAALAIGTGTLHLRAGDWPLVSRSLRASIAGASAATPYGAPYYPGRFHTHAMAFLAETGLEGRIYNPYPLGGFMSFWLAPRLQMSSSGTMNVERGAMEDLLAIGERRTVRDGESYAELLARRGLDVFLGTGLPIEPIPGRRRPSSAGHLEGEPDWLLVFRNVRSALYVRRSGPHAEANLDRVERYYAARGLPFDRRGRGLDLGGAIEADPDWAIRHGLVPADFEALRRGVERDAAAAEGPAGAPRLAMLFATLGLYEEALAVDRRLLAGRPGHAGALRRGLICSLRLGRDRAAFELARALDARGAARGREAASRWRATVREIAEAPPDARATLLSLLPLYRGERAGAVLAELAPAPILTLASHRPPSP